MIQKIGINYKGKQLKRYIDKFSDTRILVIGDIIMDEYIWGNVSRISPEAPVPVVEVKHGSQMLGGAANVINNISSLGGEPVLCGVIGNDQTGQDVLDRIKGLGLIIDGIISESDRPTSIKKGPRWPVIIGSLVEDENSGPAFTDSPNAVAEALE